MEPKRKEINDSLWEQPWDILFFAGHSRTEGKTGRIFINETDSLTVEELKNALKQANARGLRVAIFNSCDGLGLARQLADLQIPQIVVMREPVKDEVAQEFLKYFLQAFASGESFYLAVRLARERLQGLEDRFPCASWLPAIVQNPAEQPPTWAQLQERRGEESGEQGSGEGGECGECGEFSNSSHPSHPSHPSPGNPGNPGKRVRAVGAFTAVFLLGLSFVSSVVLPQLAKYSNNRGFDSYFVDGSIPNAALKRFKSAIQLDPNNAVAPYNEAWICEDLKDFDCAREKYRLAAQLGYVPAYSQLARLYIIIDKKYDAAADLSKQGLQRVKSDRVKYSLLKNLGWARLEQGRYDEAAENLQEAIALYEGRAPARCLLARVLELQGNRDESLAEWKLCLDCADPQDPDQDNWIAMARRRIENTK